MVCAQDVVEKGTAPLIRRVVVTCLSPFISRHETVAASDFGLRDGGRANICSLQKTEITLALLVPMKTEFKVTCATIDDVSENNYPSVGEF